MAINESHEAASRPAGYAALVAEYGIAAIPNWHASQVAPVNTHRIATTNGMVTETYPATYWPGDGLGNHLEFAFKYDGVNLAILACVFHAADPVELTEYIASKPTGKYARRIWYLYEYITGQRLQLADLNRGNYVDLLEPDDYVTASQGERVQRQRVNDNLLGSADFCPIVRRTDAVNQWLNTDLKQRCQTVLSDYPPELLKRALSYLYTKETKSSFEIEHIKPDASRAERFVALLQLAETEDFCEKHHLIDLQNRTVDPRFADADYRTSQNYVGETVSFQSERVHYVCPKPDDIHALMAGLLETHDRMDSAGVHPVVHAALIAYGFVFMHPFEDGNGRIHRFLIHNILARSGYTPEGLMFPVSAAMLKNPLDYDASLEAFSRPLLPLVEYTLDEAGRMTVHNETVTWYRFIDMTPQVEALFAFIEKTIDAELTEELNFLISYDRAKAAIQDIVDMPDRQIDLFIRLCLQNNGHISAGKRKSQFAMLTDDEISRLERVVNSAYTGDRI
jgi:hypothetical protein